MISKSKISKIRMLHQKKHREEQQLFIVEGRKSVMEVLSSSWEVEELFATEKWVERYTPNFSATIISEAEMEKISCMSTPPELLAIVKMHKPKIEKLPNDVPILVLDGIKDPGNMGTIIRTAEWFGFGYIVCSPDCVELTNPKVIQATMGSFCRTSVLYVDLEIFLQQQQERTIYGLCMEGEEMTQVKFHSNDILIIGSESHGISPKVMSCLSQKVNISAVENNGAESLNASIAAAIVMFHHKRSLS